MKFCKVENGVVVQTQRSSEAGFAECPEYVSCGMVLSDGEYKTPLIIISPEESKAIQIKAIENALQKIMDDEAQALGYDSVLTAITYAAETAVAKFSTDGKSFRKWRSLVWKYAYDSLAQFETDMAAYLLAVDAYNQYLLDMAQYNLDLTQYSADILVMPAITPAPVVPTPPIEVLAPVEVVAPTVEDIITNMPVRS